MNTHGLKVDFGKHAGELYTRLPVDYLKWMVNVNHSRKEIAEAELERRGTVTPDIDISGHAINKASLRCRKIWHENREDEEGLHAWLVRVSMEALEKGEKLESGKIKYLGIKFVIDETLCWPVLKTVMKV